MQRFFDKSLKREALRDADLQVLERVVFEVRDFATQYWAAESVGATASIVEGAIVGRLTFASALIQGLFEQKAELLRDMHIRINRFDTSCTSGNFGSRPRCPEPGRCRDIEIRAYELVHHANKLRREL